MDILTNTISLLFRPRQKEIARFAQDADAIQHKQLKSLLSTARNTEWGLKYDYKSIQGYADFCERIPLQTYDDIKPYVTRMINGERNILWPSVVRWYAKSSGTTNDKSKFLPVTPEILKGCHYKGGFDTVSIYLQNNPDSHFFASKGLILGGSHSPSPLNRNAHCGDLSAVLLQNLNPLVNLIRVPDKKIILMDEWESKIKAIVESTWKTDVNSLSGVPSWMLVLIKAVLQKTGSEYLTDVWPNMEVFFHGGISFEPYRDQYKALIPSDRMHYMETYNASEGFFGLQDNPEEHSLLLMIDYSVFYEFIPINEVGEEHPTVRSCRGREKLRDGDHDLRRIMALPDRRHSPFHLPLSAQVRNIGTHQELYQCLRRRTDGRQCRQSDQQGLPPDRSQSERVYRRSPFHAGQGKGPPSMDDRIRENAAFTR